MERFFTRKKVEKPGVECPRQIAVLVPVRRKSAHQVWPILGHAHFSVIEIRCWQRIERERRPITGQNQREGNPLVARRPQAEKEQENRSEERRVGKEGRSRWWP